MNNSLEYIYENTKKLIKQLENNGFLLEKGKLEDALSYGCTFGEILSNIGGELNEIYINKEKYPESFINLSKQILSDIDNLQI